MSDIKNILIFPCGTEIGLEIHQSLKYTRFINIYGASSVEDHGKYVFQNYIGNLPYFNSPGFIDAVNRVVQEHRIEYIFPAHDDVLLELARNQGKLDAEVITSPVWTCEICRSKKKTYDLFREFDFTPKVYRDIEDVQQYPVFIKPDIGQGSAGAAKLSTPDELIYELESRLQSQVVTEYLPGDEYTVDCFTDKDGELIFASMRTRGRTRNGISVHSEIIESDDECCSIARNLNRSLRFRGMWFFQLKRNSDGRYRLLEIAPRVAGTMCVHRAAGVNLPLLAVYDRMGMKVSCSMSLQSLATDRALINRYLPPIAYDRVVIDYDDTLVINGKVNVQLMMFLYQCVNQGKRLVLLTKHPGDLGEDMKKYKIPDSLFDQIIQIDAGDIKSEHIVCLASDIFIDDSYAEREAINARFGICCFGVDMLEALIDWRM